MRFLVAGRDACGYDNGMGLATKGSPGNGNERGDGARVRTMVICDEALLSEIESEVHTLENVRLHLWTDSYPLLRQLSVYLVLSHYRSGTYKGEIRLMREGARAKMEWQPFAVEFASGMDRIVLVVEMGECRFPASGDYAFEVWFFDEESLEVQKGDERLEVHTLEEET